MKHQSLDIYDDMPPMMRKYISNYGYHFSKKAYELAVNDMRRKNQSTGKEESIELWTKEQCEEFLKRYGVTVENGEMYDMPYVLSMGRADYLKSSVPDEQHLALYVKNVLDDIDGSDELPFRFWLQKRVALGKPIEWEDII